MIKEESAYRGYVLSHQANVARAYDEYGKEILGIMKNESLEDELYRLVANHDKSKFSIEEFDGYRKKFNPIEGELPEIADAEMDKAWLHHMNNNPHHPEYWVLREDTGNKPIDMPREYITEMILDWIAMGYKFNTNALQWFEKKSEYYRKIMTPYTYNTVALILNTLFGGKCNG